MANALASSESVAFPSRAFRSSSIFSKSLNPSAGLIFVYLPPETSKSAILYTVYVFPSMELTEPSCSLMVMVYSPVVAFATDVIPIDKVAANANIPIAFMLFFIIFCLSFLSSLSSFFSILPGAGFFLFLIFQIFLLWYSLLPLLYCFHKFISFLKGKTKPAK